MHGTARTRARLPLLGPLIGLALSVGLIAAVALAGRQAAAIEPLAVAEPTPVALVADALPTDATVPATTPATMAPEVTAPPATTSNDGTLAPPPGTAPPPAGPRRAMFIGDSVAWTTAVAVQPWAAAHGLVLQNEGIQGCGVVPLGPYRYFGTTYAMTDRCAGWASMWQAALDRDHPDVAVVIVGRWELMDRVFNGGWTRIGDPAFDQRIDQGFEDALRLLLGKTKVVLATQPYYHRGFRPDGGDWPEDDPARVDHLNQIIRAVAARHPEVTVVDYGARMSPGGHLAMDVDGVKLRSDGVHVAAGAGPWLGDWLLSQVQGAR